LCLRAFLAIVIFIVTSKKFFVPILLTCVFPVSGASDNTISGWSDAVHAIYNDVGGCLRSLFLLFNYWAYVSYALFAVRSPPPQPKGDRLLEASTSEFGAPKHCEWVVPFFCFCFCWMTFGSAGSSHGSGSSGTQHL
jgi:hypothetical protein